jgi:hypothetical protein
MTGPEHYRRAEHLLADANEWMNADLGWKANLTPDERLARRNSEIAEAQAHATLALTAATAAVPIVIEYGNEDAPVLNDWATAIAGANS